MISEEAKTYITDKIGKLIDDTKQMSMVFCATSNSGCTEPEKWKDVSGRLDALRGQIDSLKKICNRFELISSNILAIERMATAEKEEDND